MSVLEGWGRSLEGQSSATQKGENAQVQNQEEWVKVRRELFTVDKGATFET